jgi:membrane protein implicated in regulation of membrane protease activity
MGTPKMMIAMLGGAALVVGLVLVLATGEWWALAVAMGAHAIGSAIAIGYAWHRAGDTGGKPDPVTEARVEEEQDGGRQPARPRRTARDYEVFS